MTPEVADVLTRVSEEIEVQINALEHGVSYAARYAESTLAGENLANCARPEGMHPQIAKLIRELTLDELAARRRRLT